MAIFVACVILPSRQTRVDRRPNVLLASDSLQEISVSRPPDEDRQLPRYVKSSTFFSAHTHALMHAHMHALTHASMHKHTQVRTNSETKENDKHTHTHTHTHTHAQNLK